MRKTKMKEQQRNGKEISAKRGKRPGVFTATPKTRSLVLEGLKLGERVLKRLDDVEDLIEMIAREIKRQLDLME